MVVNKKIKVFKRILKELGVYSFFIHQFISSKRYGSAPIDTDDLDAFLEAVFKSKYGGFARAINDAFNWLETKDGNDFWSYVYNACARIDRYFATTEKAKLIDSFNESGYLTYKGFIEQWKANHLK